MFRVLPAAAGLMLSAVAALPQADPRSVLNRYCTSCHSQQAKTGNLSLEGEITPATAQKILDKVSASKMPPPGLPMPTAAERQAIESWAASLPGVMAVKRDAGRVTARRLNRAEYNNTVRDLLSVALRPADEFPVDDSGYGFDNIGDVLSLSPMLMEKYMSTARKIARAAVGNSGGPASASILAHYLGKRSADGDDKNAANTYLPFSMRGALYG